MAGLRRSVRRRIYGIICADDVDSGSVSLVDIRDLGIRPNAEGRVDIAPESRTAIEGRVGRQWAGVAAEEGLEVSLGDYPPVLSVFDGHGASEVACGHDGRSVGILASIQ